MHQNHCNKLEDLEFAEVFEPMCPADLYKKKTSCSDEQQKGITS